MTEFRPIVDKYFQEHPEQKDGVIKAYYAYHLPNAWALPKAHNFMGDQRESTCSWCGRSREMVRHDDLPAGCQKRPETVDIQELIRLEEEKALALLAKAETEVPKLVSKMGMSEETMAKLYDTYGYDSETVNAVLERLNQKIL